MSDLHRHTHQVVGEDHTQAALHRQQLMLHVSIERTVLKGGAARLSHTTSGSGTMLRQPG
jgi:hypothetical protein